MFRKMLGVFTAITAALLLVGVAWASGNSPASEVGSSVTIDSSSSSTNSDGSTSSTNAEGSTTTSLDGTVTTVGGGSTSSTTFDDTSTTTLDDDNSTTSTTTPGSGSSTTNPGDNSSTTIDDDDDDDEGVILVDGVTTYSVGTAGTVTIEVLGGQLLLVDVSANGGWSYEIKKSEWNRIEVRFESGDSEGEIEVEVDDGRLVVEIEFDND